MCLNPNCGWRQLFLWQSIVAAAAVIMIAICMSEISDDAYAEVKTWHEAHPKLRVQIVQAYSDRYISLWEYSYISNERDRCNEKERARRFAAQLERLEPIQLDLEEDDDGPFSTTSRSGQ